MDMRTPVVRNGIQIGTLVRHNNQWGYYLMYNTLCFGYWKNKKDAMRNLYECCKMIYNEYKTAFEGDKNETA